MAYIELSVRNGDRKLKIGLMTWFKYHNYGTALQVFAMDHVLSKLGHEVTLINYVSHVGRTVNYNFYERVINKINNYFYVPMHKDNAKEQLFQSFLSDISLTDEKRTLSELQDLNSMFDVFICGSDQIWSPFCFDKHYFLDFVSDDGKKIAYAPSVGTSRIENANIKEQIKELVSCFGSISTREKMGSELIKSLIGRDVNTVLDPTLLIYRDEWEKIVKKTSDNTSPKYAVVYLLGHNNAQWRVIKKTVSEMNLELKIIPVYENDFSRKGCLKYPIGPCEFVKLIANSEYVFTDSFHGTIFSVIFNKNFVVFERFSRKSKINQNLRIHNLLSILNLEDRLFSKNSKWKTCIEYEEVNKKLEILREQSFEYLRQSLRNVRKEAEKKNNIRKYHTLCCGCGMCAFVCPVNAIKIQINEDGFYSAIINNDKCISCGKCKKSCPFVHIKSEKIENADFYSYKDNRADVLSVSSSGGLAFALSEMLIDDGYVIIGCEYAQNIGYAKHVIITNKKELHRIQGSKYMQSDFAHVIPELKKYNKIAVFGTPCQVAAAKKLLGVKAVYVELICHGIPSLHLYKKYKLYLKEKYGINTNEMNVIFRYKACGWRERYIYVNDGEKSVINHQSNDPYFLMFEHGLCYGKQCFECPWRDQTVADIRIGDFWGDKYKEDTTGVSIAVVNTPMGVRMINNLKSINIGLVQNVSKEDYFLNQQTHNLPEPDTRAAVIDELKKDDVSLENIIKRFIVPLEKQKIRSKRVARLKKGIKKLV